MKTYFNGWLGQRLHPVGHPICLIDQSTATKPTLHATSEQTSFPNDELTFPSMHVTGSIEEITDVARSIQGGKATASIVRKRSSQRLQDSR